MEIKKNDWIRFMRDGELVIGVVCYIQPPNTTLGYGAKYYTDVGICNSGYVLEVRRFEYKE